MQEERHEIQLPTGFVGDLANEFKVSRQTVYTALRDVTRNAKAKQIRARAKEMLITTANNIIV